VIKTRHADWQEEMAWLSIVMGYYLIYISDNKKEKYAASMMGYYYIHKTFEEPNTRAGGPPPPVDLLCPVDALVIHLHCRTWRLQQDRPSQDSGYYSSTLENSLLAKPVQERWSLVVAVSLH
jgi:hypothetical protein